MTLEQMLAWNGKIPFPEYEALLSELEKKKRSLVRTCATAFDEEDALSVLEDEKGSERWHRHEKKRQNALERAEKLRAEIKALEAALAGGPET